LIKLIGTHGGDLFSQKFDCFGSVTVVENVNKTARNQFELEGTFNFVEVMGMLETPVFEGTEVIFLDG
jgi:hypothetical protein